jgi:hypothetical protein
MGEARAALAMGVWATAAMEPHASHGREPMAFTPSSIAMRAPCGTRVQEPAPRREERYGLANRGSFRLATRGNDEQALKSCAERRHSATSIAPWSRQVEMGPHAPHARLASGIRNNRLDGHDRTFTPRKTQDTRRAHDCSRTATAEFERHALFMRKKEINADTFVAIQIVNGAVFEFYSNHSVHTHNLTSHSPRREQT